MSNGMSAMRRHGDESANNDFVDLIRALWVDRWIIGGIATTVMILAISYALVSPKVYQSDVIVWPPSPEGIAEYNQLRLEAGLQPLKVEEVYKVFTDTLNSGVFREDFLEEVRVAGGHEGKGDLLPKAQDGKVAAAISVSNPDRRRPRKFMVSAMADTPEKSATLVALYVDRADTRARGDLAERLKTEIAARLKGIDSRVQVERQLAQNRRQQRIDALQEALVLAKQAGFDKPVAGGAIKDSHTQSPSDDSRPLYMLGTRALSAELAALQAGKADSAFNARLRDLNDERIVLQSVKVDGSRVAAFRMERPTGQGDHVAKPQRLLTIVFGVVIGVILGVLVGMIRFMRRRHGAGVPVRGHS